jgi:hypothetical protein
MLATMQLRIFCLPTLKHKDKKIILPVVFYGCETQPPILREHRLMLFENREFFRIFGLKTDEVLGSWRKLCKEECQYLYSSPNIIKDQIKEDETSRACSAHG